MRPRRPPPVPVLGRGPRPALAIALAAAMSLAFPLPASAADAPASGAASAPGGFRVSQFVVEGENPLSDADTRTVLANHLGAQSGLNDLVQAARDLEEVLRADGHLFHHVYLPPQTIENETVRLAVQPLRIANVTVTGNEHYDEANVRRAVPQLQPGTAPDVDPLKRGLSLANDNPARHITLNLKEGRTAGTVDAELEVRDRRPWSVFANLTNVGTEDNGRSRLAVGLQHANLFDNDSSLALSYTTSPEATSRVKQYGASWRLPIYPLGGVLSVVYAKSDVDAGTLQDVFDVSGAGTFTGFQYTQHLFQRGAYRQQVTVAVDDRRFENDVSFLGNPIGTTVRSRPLTLRYAGNYRGTEVQAGFGVAYVRNLDGGNDNSGATYAQVRAGAPRDWHLVRYDGHVNAALPWAMQLRLSFEGQATGQPLIPGEQFGVGGSDSIRGLEERAVTGDSGQRLGIELGAPPLREDLDLFGFVDAGRVERENPQRGEVHHDTVVSAGMGLRWQWRDQVALKLEYGHALQEASSNDAGKHKLHLNLFVRY